MPDSVPFVSGIILAAGQSKRMGRVKQLLPFKDKPMLSYALRSARYSRLGEVILVLGHAAGEIKRQVDCDNVTVVLNRDYGDGQSTSLQAGIAATSRASMGALFLLGDQPLVTAAVINRILEEFHPGRERFLIPTFEGRRGNPVLIDRSVFPRLESLSGDQGARILFSAYPDEIREIDVGNPCILLDIDTWDDYTVALSQ